MKYTLNLTANIWEKLDVALREGEKIRIQGASPDSKFRIEFNDGIASPGVGDKPGLILDGLQEVSMSNPYLWVMSDRTMDVDVEVCPTAASGSIPLPGGAATEAKQDDQITELQAITTAIQNKKQVGYARVEDANGDEFNQVSTIDASVAPPVMTVYYFDDSGVAQTPVEPINVINTDQVSSDMLSFKAIVATVNYEIGDTLTKRTILTNGAKTGSFWTNETTNLAISAPPSTDYEQADDVVSIKAIGDITDTSATSDTGNFSLIAFSKRTQERFTSLFGLFGTKSDTKEIDPDATTSSAFGYLKGLLSAIQTKTIKTASKGTTDAGNPTSKDIDSDTQALHMVLAEAAKTNGVPASGLTAIVGSFSAIGQSAPFTPIAGRDFNIHLIFSGAIGQVNLERSFDEINFFPLTGSGVGIMRFTADANEQWGDSEVGVQYRLNCTALSAGSVIYRISQ
jgi:hypothetical protein